MAVWSLILVSGVSIIEPGEEPSKNHMNIHRSVIKSAGGVMRKKGYTNWPIRRACGDIAKTVLHNNNEIIPVSTFVRGFNGIEEGVYFSFPCRAKQGT